MKPHNLSPIQKHFLYLFATGATFPDAALGLAIDDATIAEWRTQPEFKKAHFRACHDRFRHMCDLAQIEEIRSYLNKPKSEIESPPAQTRLIKPRKATLPRT